MSRLSLTFACCRYDRMEAIREGAFPIEGIDLNCITLRSGREVFDRMVGGQEFDVAELSASEFISLTGRGDCPFVALPVFPSRVFRHGYIFVNTRRGIGGPKDLEGKRVGLPLYTQTAAIWARGHLTHQFDVDIDAIRWVQGAVETSGAHGRPHAPPLLRPARIEQNASTEPLGALLARGAIDALIGSRKPDEFGRHPDIARLFPNYRALERQLYQETRDLSDHASRGHPPRPVRARALDRAQPLRRVRGVEAPRAHAHALRRVAEHHAAVADR